MMDAPSSGGPRSEHPKAKAKARTAKTQTKWAGELSENLRFMKYWLVNVSFESSVYTVVGVCMNLHPMCEWITVLASLCWP